MILFPFLVTCLLACSSHSGQQTANPSVSSDTLVVGGGCETCEYMFIGMPSHIDAVDTSAGWEESGQRLLVRGRVLQKDGKTPAKGILLYYWQTDHEGLYSYRDNMPPGTRRHGHIRGWIRTDSEGRYSLYTNRPAPYPRSSIPAHIHMVVKEAGMSEYYVDEFEFDDDKFLTGAERKKRGARGGSGILRPEKVNGVQVAERNIILGLNIPGHPAMQGNTTARGLAVGEEQPSFIPFHAWGPDKGSRACPVCKYGRYYGIIYFLGTDPDWTETRQWLQWLEKVSAERTPYLKVYLVYGNPQKYSAAARQKQLQDLGSELDLKRIALTYVPSFSDEESEVHFNRIAGLQGNVFVVYKARVIIGKYENLRADDSGFGKLLSTLHFHADGTYPTAEVTSNPGF